MLTIVFASPEGGEALGHALAALKRELAAQGAG